MKNLFTLLQFSKNNSISHTPTDPHVHTQTHTHTHQQHDTCLDGIYLGFSYTFLLLPYEALISRSHKFQHKSIKVVSLQQHDMLCGSMYGIY